jgi:hypothetical protein
MNGQGISLVLLSTALVAGGCGQLSAVRSSSQTELIIEDQPAEDRSILAGEWEYEEGGAVMLRLDKQGNGTYSYKDGRFETTRFDGHTWAGRWYQKENDREGGFVVKLSADCKEGEGTWWYIRIGEDRTPTQNGGTFHLSRKTSLTNLSETPPAP